MGILFTKMRRDIWYNKGRSFSIILIVLMAAAIYGGLFLAWINISNTYDNISDDLHSHSVRFQLDGVNQSQIDLSSIDGIQQWDYRLMMFSGINIPTSNDSFTSVLYGIQTNQAIQVDNVKVLQGHDLQSESNRSMLFLTKFMESNNLKIGDNVTVLNSLTGPYNFSIRAKVFSAEYSYNVNPLNGLPDLRGFPVGWVPLESLQNLFGMKDTVNEVVVRIDKSIVSNKANYDAKINEIKTELLKLTPQVSFIKYEEEANTKMKNGDVGSLGDIARVFGMVVLLIALFGVYDSVSKLIANQRNYIGTMRALGGSKTKVTLHYTSIAAVLGAIGVILSVPVGWWMSNSLSDAYAGILGLPAIQKGLIISAFYESSIVNFSLVVVIGFFAALSASNIEPREAMSSMYITASYKKRSLIEKALEWLPTFKKPSSKIPLRGLFQNKRRTLLTIFTYSISLVLMISSLAMVSTFTVGLDNNFNHYEKYDLQVIFNSEKSPSAVQSTIAGLKGVSDYEQFILNSVEVKYGGKTASTTLYAYEANSNLRKLKLESSTSSDGIMLGSIVASDLDIAIGDSVDVFNTTYKVGNLVDDLLGGGVFLSIPEAQKLLNLGDKISGYLIKMDGSMSEKNLKKEILESGLPVGLILSSQEVKDGINSMMEAFLAMIGIVVLIGFVIVAMFSFNTVVLDVMSREMEFVNLRALGSKKRTLMKIILSQTLFIVIFGSILAIPLGYYVSDVVNQRLMKGLIILDTVVEIPTYLIAIGAAFIASMVGVIAAYRYVIRIDLVNATRKRVNS